MTEPGSWRLTIGARLEPGGVHFRVLAPTARSVDVILYGPAAERVFALRSEPGGYHAASAPDVAAGARYRFRIDGGYAYPDPASRSQPDGVHGPSEVIDPDQFEWRHRDWPGRNLEELVIYELHVGTFTPAGTFDAVRARLDHLGNLGVTAIELMPIAGFPGRWNWGYDGVNLFAPNRVYGGPDGFKQLVDAAHERGLALILDVVYNHLGPEGNYIPAVTGGRYFTRRHSTPWGDAVNVDGPGSAAVRDFIIQNALFWCTEYDVDGLRLDATHAIIDDSETHIMAELSDAIHSLPGRRRFIIAEDERNEPVIVSPRSAGGFGMDAIWADDLHHQIRRFTAGDRHGYFASYGGTARDIVRTLRLGWSGERYADAGESSTEPADPAAEQAVLEIAPPRFVHCIQNHDQVGNRAKGERLNHQIPLSVYRAATVLLLVSPYTPLVWMGQEWAATSPFQYFTDHPEELGKLVTEGRRWEFRHFPAFQDPDLRKTIPDPQAEETFERSKLRWDEIDEPPHSGVLMLYRELLDLRRSHAAFRPPTRRSFAVDELGEGAIALRRTADGRELLAIVNLRGEIRMALADLPGGPEGRMWRYLLSSEESRFGGDGNWGSMEADGTLHLVQPGAVLLD
jgi:maltooligosyltrehalose trehalohydrolase